jgi:hypothetical protein
MGSLPYGPTMTSSWFLMCLVLALILGERTSGSVALPVWPPELPTDPRELAEYHFNLARSYEYWGWIGRAHLHYEIVHDQYGSFDVSEEATRRMQELRDIPPQDESPAGITQFHCFTSHEEWDRRDYSAPTLNPWTTVTKGKIWPPVTKVWVNPYWPRIVTGPPFRETAPTFRGVGRFLGINLYGCFALESEIKWVEGPEWSIPGGRIPWLRNASPRSVFGLWN